MEITQTTPQSQIDTIALALVNRFLSEVDARTTVDTVKLGNAIQRASEPVRHTIFLLAQQVRASNWATDKSLMGRAIPVLQTLIDVDPHKHYYFGQLAFALKDRIEPDWKAAKAHFDRAIELLGERVGIPLIPTTHSGGNRPPVPEDSVHPFRVNRPPLATRPNRMLLFYP